MAPVQDHELTLRPKSQEEIDAWLPVAMREYEESRMEAGDSAEQADAASALSQAQFFPGGRLVEGHLLFTIVVNGEDAGWLWLGPYQDSSAENWWIWDIRVFDEFQRRGIARLVLTRADGIAREHGARSLGLNVFAYNLPAITLYESLGYLTTSLHMAKEL
ncbi:GNAT family N-acetyltransferase [Rathayibacter sp. YIM 133350]|uniref:GNAT family N-acetyltransferase n=1 Tax=Rathayibacter sp. YIM 133350 TaxID=3131992 RepID=UPI00307DED14